MRKFASSLSNNLVWECKGALLNRDMDFSRLFVHMQQNEQQKKRMVEATKKDRQAKRDRPTNQNYNQHQDGNGGNRQLKKKFQGNIQSSSNAPNPRPPVDLRFQSSQPNSGECRVLIPRRVWISHSRHTLAVVIMERIICGGFFYCKVCYAFGCFGHLHRDYPSRKNIGGTSYK